MVVLTERELLLLIHYNESLEVDWANMDAQPAIDAYGFDKGFDKIFGMRDRYKLRGNFFRAELLKLKQKEKRHG